MDHHGDVRVSTGGCTIICRRQSCSNSLNWAKLIIARKNDEEILVDEFSSDLALAA